MDNSLVGFTPIVLINDKDVRYPFQSSKLDSILREVTHCYYRDLYIIPRHYKHF